MRTLRTAAATLIAFLALTASALAHHINDSASTADCTHATVAFKDFTTYDYRYGVDTHVLIDGHEVAFKHVTSSYPAGQFSFTITVYYPAPQDTATHTVVVRSNWATSHDSFTRTISGCTQPPKPPAPTPTPPTPAPPVPTPPTPQPPVPPKHAKKCPGAGKYSITVRPRHATHGLVRFRLNGPYVKKVRWYVDMRRRGVQGERFERTSGKGGRVYRVYLWAQPVFGARLWGQHWVTVRAMVGNGHGRRCTVHERLRYFNQDPPLA